MRNSLYDLKENGNILHKKQQKYDNRISFSLLSEKKSGGEINVKSELYVWIIMIYNSIFHKLYYRLWVCLYLRIFKFFIICLEEQWFFIILLFIWDESKDWWRFRVEAIIVIDGDDQCRKTWDYQFSRFDIRSQLRYLIRTWVVWTFEKRRWLDWRIKASPRIHFIESELF